jgi:hypothetical protein
MGLICVNVANSFLDEIDGQAAPGLAVHVICGNLSAHKAPAVRKWLLALSRVQVHFQVGRTLRRSAITRH